MAGAGAAGVAGSTLMAGRCACGTESSPWITLRNALVEVGGGSAGVVSLVEKYFSCGCELRVVASGCGGQGRQQRIHLPSRRTPKPTGSTVLALDSFESKYVDGSVCLCGGTKVAGSCRWIHLQMSQPLRLQMVHRIRGMMRTMRMVRITTTRRVRRSDPRVR